MLRRHKQYRIDAEIIGATNVFFGVANHYGLVLAAAEGRQGFLERFRVGFDVGYFVAGNNGREEPGEMIFL